jgi:uncharacterized protein YbcI
MAQQQPPDPAIGDAVPARVSAAVERLYLDRYGKGPLHTETFINGSVVTTLLRDVFTPVEKAMVENGRNDSVLVNRMQWQNATDEMFRAAVAKATGRGVLAAISGFDAVHDIATEVFVLAPE